MLLCHARPGQLATSRVKVSSSISELLPAAASLTSAPAPRLALTYQGAVLGHTASLQSSQVKPGGLVMVTVLPPPPTAPPATPTVKMTGDEVKRFTIAFGSALKHPAFNKVVRRLVQRENMESLAAACPGLATDLVAQSFLTRPELLQHLLDPETLAKVGASHPCILEAANNLAAAVHEEQAKGGRDQEQAAPASGGSYYLDEMSDDDMEEEAAQGPSGRGAGGRARSSNSLTAITPAQLAQALSAAQGGSGSVSGGFQGVTGLGLPGGGEGAGGQQAGASPQSRITGDMFQAAMMQAMMQSGMAGGQQQATSVGGGGGGGEPDYSEQVARMREMGIVDEGLAVRALQIMGGDLQAAVDLVLQGWDGLDDSMQ